MMTITLRGHPMSSVAELIAQCDDPPHGQLLLIQDLAQCLPNAQVLEFLFGILESTDDEKRLPRIEVLRTFAWYVFRSKADKERLRKSMKRILDTSKSWVERSQVLATAASWMHDRGVREIVYDVLLHETDPKVRFPAVGCLRAIKRHKGARDVIEMCAKLRDDPEHGTTMKLLLESWRKAEARQTRRSTTKARPAKKKPARKKR